MVLAEGMLPGIVHRPPELGRIRLGEKTDRGAPRRLNTFRLTSASQKALEAAAALYGGTVRRWAGAPDEGMWELYTTVAELDILIPGTLGAVSQAFELWQGGTCERRCDGTTESISGEPCRCDPAVRECDVMTRIKVMLPRVPGLGVWRLDTAGWQAATTLPSTLMLLAQMSRGSWIPAVLRAEQRSKRARLPNGKVETHRFVVPVLDLPGTTIGQLVEGAALVEPPQLEAGERPVPPTARERVAQQRARVEMEAAPVDEEPPLPAPPTTNATPDTGVPGGTAAAEEATATGEVEAPVRPGAPSSDQTPAAADVPPPIASGTTAAGALSRCEAVPVTDHPLGLSEQCAREAGHEGVHKSRQGSWS